MILYKVIDEYEYEYEVPNDVFYANESVKQCYLEMFADEYNISVSSAERIIRDYDLYDECVIDTTIINKMIKEYNEELYDEFYEYYHDKYDEINFV